MPAFNSGRAPWEIPGVILGYDRGPRFDQASPGAQVGKIAPDHIELNAGKTRGQTVEIQLSTRRSDRWLSSHHSAHGLG